AGEEGQRADQIVGYFHGVDRLHLCDRGKFLVHRLEAGAWFARECAGRTREPWRNCVDGDAVGSEIGRERACKANYPTLARDIVGKAGNDRAERARCHIDYPAPFARPHARHEGGCHQESTVEIDRKDLAPIGEGHVEEIFLREDAGAIYHDFDVSEFTLHLLRHRREVSEDTSQFTASACRPAASTNFTVSWPSVRSAIATCTPSSANRLAKA